jgi:ABC-type lipoprotein export system ATPase subunit
MAEVAIRAKGLTKWFGEGETRTVAVNDVSFEAYFGEILFIVGPSGSGKTTMLSMVSGIMRPNAGSVEIEGTDIWSLSNDKIAEFRLHKLGFVFQDNHLFPRLTTVENVAIPLILQRRDWIEAIGEARRDLKIVGLENRAELPPVKLSGGEQQRDTMLHKMTPQQWHDVINTNLGSCFNMSHAVIGGMRERGFGRIVNIASINGQAGQFGQTNYSVQSPTQDRLLMGRHEMLDRMAILLGGRASELLVFADPSTGAADDLAKATDMARGMVERFGMAETLGPVAHDTDTPHFLDQPGNFWRQRTTSPTTEREIDEAVRDLLRQALDRAMAILRTNRSSLESGAELLLERESVEAEELPPVTVEVAA